MKIVVVGAGIVGLNTALEFQKSYPNADISIIAENFDQNTTSDGAAGLIMPSPSFMGPSYEITQQWMKNSFSYYKTLMENTNAGVIWVSGYTFSNESQEVCENAYMKLVSPDYRPLSSEELTEKGYEHYKYGVYMSTMVVPCRKILPWSLQRFEENGGRIIKNKITRLDSLTETYDVIFNCTGLGAKFLCNDIEMVPIRGQIIQIEAPWIENFYISDFIHYVIPCGYNNFVTLGGTQDYGSYSKAVDQYASKSIMENCIKFDPNIGRARIVKTWVGHRPHRSRVRVESETCNNSVIIHHYGHGGYGVTSSPGSAQYAVTLFSESQRRASSSKL